MKKFFTKLCTVALAAITAFTFVACGEDATKREEDQHLDVYIENHGYRTEGIKAIIESFAQQDWVKEKYPDLTYDFTINNSSAYVTNKVKNPKTNTHDIMFTGTELISFFEKDSKGSYKLLDITESVYNQDVIDEPGVKFSDKMHQSFLSYYQYTTKNETTPKYFEVPWVTGLEGLLYNEEILANYGYTDGNYPVTTEELIELCKKIKSNPSNSGNVDGYVFMNCDSAYSSYLLYQWWAQYDGVESYNLFWEGKYRDARGIHQDYHVFEQEGRLKALEVIEQMFKYENGFYDLEHQNDGDFMTRQTRVLKGECAMTYCADWFDTEMAETAEQIKSQGGSVATIKIMKMPIVSALTDKLDTVKSDDLLRKVVRAIDNGEKSYEGVYQVDFDRIVEARGVYKTPGTNHVAVIPTASNSQSIAIDVLRYMATDTCQEAYMKATNGQNMPFDYEVDTTSEMYQNFSPLQKSRLIYFYSDNISVLPQDSRYALKRLGGYAALSLQTSHYNTIFGTQGNETTPIKIFEDTKAAWGKDVFNFALLTAGLRNN